MRTPLYNSSLEITERVELAVQYLDQRLRELGESFTRVDDAQMQERISTEIAEVTDQITELQTDGPKYLTTLDAIERFKRMGSSDDVGSISSKQVQLLREGSYREVIELFTGGEGLRSSDEGRKRLALKVATGKQDEAIAEEILEIVRQAPLGGDALPLAIAAAAHLEHPEATLRIWPSIRTLDLERAERTLSLSEGALLSSVVIDGTFAYENIRYHTLACKHLRDGHADVLIDNLDRILELREKALDSPDEEELSGELVAAISRCWDEGLEDTLASDKYGKTMLSLVGGYATGLPIQDIQLLAKSLEHRARRSLQEPVACIVLAYNPTEANVGFLQETYEKGTGFLRFWAAEGLSMASHNLQVLNDPEGVSEKTNLEQSITELLKDPNSKIRLVAIEGSNSQDVTRRGELVARLADEKNGDVARAICNKIYPFKAAEAEKILKALESNGHYEMHEYFRLEADLSDF